MNCMITVFLRSFPIVLVLLCLCSPPPAKTVLTSYAASVLYQHRSFSGASLSGATVLVLPILTKSGPDTSASLSPSRIARLLAAGHNEVETVTKEEFETRYAARHDTGSLSSFYQLLFKGNVVACANSDSVWKEMKTAYCLVARITNGLTIRGFNGTVKRRMNMETEFWDVDSAETVLRIQVQASATGERITDAEFILAALGAAFEKLPVYAPSNNEQKW
jgi:hypothetical protein